MVYVDLERYSLRNGGADLYTSTFCSLSSCQLVMPPRVLPVNTCGSQPPSDVDYKDARCVQKV